MKKHVLILSLAASAVLADTFTLGQINVLNTPIEFSPFEQTMTSNTIAQQNSETVADALDNISGISLGMTGARNETTVSIRGFDAKRVGVFIDGIPAYVPYDGNFDYDRFLTADIAEIDVAKGYSSVAYGANTMGGVVNIISKRPSKALEGEVKAGMVLDSDGDLSRRITSINIGTRQDHLYAQLGAVYSDQNHYRLSDDYMTSTSQPEGDRLRSEAEDYKVSFKTGYIADDGSELAIGYSNQNGQKQQPPSTNAAYNTVRYWDWPYWDKESVFITGQKNFGNSYLKALAYYDKFQNSLYAYDNISYTTMTNKSSFKSKYDDYSAGARIEYGVDFDKHFLTAAANYKKDSHKGYDISKTTDAETMTENYEDHTLSFGIEDVYTLSSQWQILGGISYDQRTADKLYDTNPALSTALSLESQSSYNPEVAVVFSPDETSKIRASIARKTYMPSMKDRYSRTLKVPPLYPNPKLDNEVATHYELSYQKQLGAISTRLNGYFTRVDNAIQQAVYTPDPTYMQNQNVGTFDHRGIEAELNYKSDGLEAGGNYTYISVKNRTNESLKRTDVPKHQLFTYAQMDMGSNIALYGDMKFREGAYDQITDGSYVINPTFTTFDIKAIYKATTAITAEVGVKNLTDKLVQYDLGFPVAGREFFANLGYKF